MINDLLHETLWKRKTKGNQEENTKNVSGRVMENRRENRRENKKTDNQATTKHSFTSSYQLQIF
jgi:hypothetical protein